MQNFLPPSVSQLSDLAAMVALVEGLAALSKSEAKTLVADMQAAADKAAKSAADAAVAYSKMEETMKLADAQVEKNRVAAEKLAADQKKLDDANKALDDRAKNVLEAEKDFTSRRAADAKILGEREANVSVREERASKSEKESFDLMAKAGELKVEYENKLSSLRTVVG